MGLVLISVAVFNLGCFHCSSSTAVFFVCVLTMIMSSLTPTHLQCNQTFPIPYVFILSRETGICDKGTYVCSLFISSDLVSTSQGTTEVIIYEDWPA